MFDQAAQHTLGDLKSSADFVFQPVAFERYTDMTDNLTADDMVDFILKLKDTYKDVVDKIVMIVTHLYLIGGHCLGGEKTGRRYS